MVTTSTTPARAQTHDSKSQVKKALGGVNTQTSPQTSAAGIACLPLSEDPSQQPPRNKGAVGGLQLSRAGTPLVQGNPHPNRDRACAGCAGTQGQLAGVT